MIVLMFAHLPVDLVLILKGWDLKKHAELRLQNQSDSEQRRLLPVDILKCTDRTGLSTLAAWCIES